MDATTNPSGAPSLTKFSSFDFTVPAKFARTTIKAVRLVKMLAAVKKMFTAWPWLWPSEQMNDGLMMHPK